MPSRILIAGGGLAAQRAAETLRARGHDGAIQVICAEPVAPYDRPPLSKELAATPFRPAGWYADNDVELLLGRRACALDVGARRVVLDEGTASYDALVVATGSRPRRLPALTGRPNVVELRTVADAERLRSLLVPGPRLAIVGGGFVGLEVAATARRLGAAVTVIEAAAAPLARVLGPSLGGRFAALPSFWSDQYGIRIQLVGSAAGGDAVEVDGSLEHRSFTAALRRRGVLCGALLVGRPRELPTWRRLLADAHTERKAA